jgi:hypothetical protein
MKKRWSLIVVILILGLFFFGCEKKVYVIEDPPPSAPKGLYSITQDQAVELNWESNDESDFSYYKIWRNTSPSGTFTLRTNTSDTTYTDQGLTNGVTYWYFITAVDRSGNESNDSKLVYDTPRPEGWSVRVYDADTLASSSGFDFSAGGVVAWNNVGADIYFDYYASDGVFYAIATEGNFIQDFGYTNHIDDVNVAPDQGWSNLYIVEIISGHSYVVYTYNNHYAKFRVESITISRGYLVIDWAYQVDPGNPELKIVKKP